MVFKNEKYSLVSVSGKFLILLPILCILIGCNQPNNQLSQMQSKTDSLEKQLNKTYKPGLGEFMTGIQLHHAKLWFAGKIRTGHLRILKFTRSRNRWMILIEFCKDRPEVKSIGMLKPAIDSVTDAIHQKNLQSFKNSFSLLTNTCNNCHKATDHGFNVVIIPTNPPVSNQDFRVPH